jgi:hypothetical protein
MPRVTRTPLGLEMARRNLTNRVIRGIVFGAISDNQDFQTSGQPAALGPVGVEPIRPEGLPLELAILFEATHEILPIVPNPFQQGLSSTVPIHAASQRVSGIWFRSEPGMSTLSAFIGDMDTGVAVRQGWRTIARASTKVGRDW